MENNRVSAIWSILKIFISVHKREIIFILIIFLVATLSFGLGYLANQELNHSPIIIEKRAP